jgi:type II secretory ATPase GspE/PulE/Tfp pilus assembly ATPase PilB-like protein
VKVVGNESDKPHEGLEDEEDEIVGDCSSPVKLDRIADIKDEDPPIKIAKLVIQRALHERATELTVEPFEDGLRVLYCIDGEWRDTLQLPKYALEPLLTRLKIMAGMNIAERRVPQEGEIIVRHWEREFRLQSRTYQMEDGEAFKASISEIADAEVEAGP